MIEYIEELNDEQSISSNRAIILFRSLEEQDHLDLDDSIKICRSFTFDLLIHLLEEHLDPMNTLPLSELIGKQKEREKQNIISSEDMTTDSKFVKSQLQQCGMVSHFHTSIKKHEEYLLSEEREGELETARIDARKELFTEEELEIMERNNVQIQSAIREEEGEEGYDQFDNDREEEGEDPNDIDGEYRD